MPGPDCVSSWSKSSVEMMTSTLNTNNRLLHRSALLEGVTLDFQHDFPGVAFMVHDVRSDRSPSGRVTRLWL